MSEYLFYLIVFCLTFFALCAILSVNAIHAVLLLILTFVSATFLLITGGSEFYALALTAVYVGAVAVMLLFALTTLGNVALQIKGKRYVRGAGVYSLLSLIILCEFFIFLGKVDNSSFAIPVQITAREYFVGSVVEIGKYLCGDYFLYFELASVVLTAAVIGAVALVNYNVNQNTCDNLFVKKQSMRAQRDRRASDCLVLHDIISGSGVKL